MNATIESPAPSILTDEKIISSLSPYPSRRLLRRPPSRRCGKPDGRGELTRVAQVTIAGQ